MSDEWDEKRQLEWAIALSLGQQPETQPASPTQLSKVIDLCSDEESATSRTCSSWESTQGRKAVELDGQSAADTLDQKAKERASGLLYSLPENDSLGRFSRDVRPKTPVRAPSFLHRMDRKVMEEERLARKRKAPVSPPPTRSVKAAKEVVSLDVDLSLGSGRHPSAAGSGTKLAFPHQTHTIQRTPTPKGLGVQYPRGIVKKTWAQGYQRDGDIKLEEVLQKDDLKTAVLSAFQWDMYWLFSKLDMGKTNLLLVMQAKDEETMVFIIDLPRLPDRRGVGVEDLTFFGKELVHFLRAMIIDEAVIEGVLNFDFTGTSELAFVHTM
ncbi:MAG: hypothetical protein M1839_005149 [Geoglossum umbratile]|nr:MAG: hypothetical protein M1839_005149 [Geoglossum umbratile]